MLTSRLKNLSRAARAADSLRRDFIALFHWVEGRTFAVWIGPNVFQDLAHTAFERANPILATAADGSRPADVHGLRTGAASVFGFNVFIHAQAAA